MRLYRAHQAIGHVVDRSHAIDANNALRTQIHGVLIALLHRAQHVLLFEDLADAAALLEALQTVFDRHIEPQHEVCFAGLRVEGVHPSRIEQCALIRERRMHVTIGDHDLVACECGFDKSAQVIASIGGEK